ncbi:hypothetical protein DW229_08885 [Sutterella sp. AM18-8-1]|jgi:quercetin dioxygenase-like cupin family protein|nr:hypothetical protein DW229_08885 [Sutterella sp. AM18-8-1]
MNFYKLAEMKGGWFIGDFSPSILKTKEFEIAVKHYKKGTIEKAHHHSLAREFTLVLGGVAKFNDQIVRDGEIVEIIPGESNQFSALTDLTTVVVKTPSVKNDKFFD